MAPGELATRLMAEASTVQAEMNEIDLLIQQARVESGRHETRRAGAAEKLSVAAERLAAGAGGTPRELVEQAQQLVAIARRAALMEAQIDLLEGKRKSAARLHEALADHANRVAALADAGGRPEAETGGEAGVAGVAPGTGQVVLAAQEDMRREIARQMHDGPAQSLTNIVLQAQIVERLLESEPDKAAAEVRQLTAMVQRTLDATKTFIFDVRPMVLDDLGLVPTLRRSCRDRGRRAGLKVEFESVGVDRRLPVELESGLFRILDDTLAVHLASKPDRVRLHLDWGERLRIELSAARKQRLVPEPDLPPMRKDMPPALAAMVEERKRLHAEAVEAAHRDSLCPLPDRTWQDVAARARALGVSAELVDDGSKLRLTADISPSPNGD